LFYNYGGLTLGRQKLNQQVRFKAYKCLKFNLI
jgi:hypothetical protein